MNHENISCTLTGEVIEDRCLYVDEVMQSRLKKVDRYTQKGADEASNKSHERYIRTEVVASFLHSTKLVPPSHSAEQFHFVRRP